MPGNRRRANIKSNTINTVIVKSWPYIDNSVSKRVEARDIQLDPATRLYYVEVEKPDMESTNGDLERLLHALYQQWGLAHIIGDLRTLQILQCALRKGNWQVTVAVYFGQGRSNGRIINVWPGFYDDGIYGIALDIGSTTVAGHCCNLQTGEVLATAGLMTSNTRQNINATIGMHIKINFSAPQS
jgi:uncharacterized 2Fe-2S/4Fe-4S cluster protein (DUF4445 family)